jgi:hypothetical protein
LKKPIVRLGITVGTLTCAAVMAAGCLSSTGNTAPSGSSGTSTGTSTGTTGSSGTTAGTTTGTGTTGGTGAGTTGTSSGTASYTSASDTTGTATAGEVVLDDFTNNESETGGSWYTYSDRTLPNSEPPIPQPGKTDPGSITPAEGMSFPVAADDGRGPWVAGDGGLMPQPYREVTGGGETTWGCGFGLDLISGTPDGGAVALNSCTAYLMDAGVTSIFDTSGDNPNVGIPQPFNAQTAPGGPFTGVAFYGTSFGTAAESVTVQMDDGRTNLWGGVCNVCLNGGKCVAGADGGKDCPCSDSYADTFLFPAGQWKRFEIDFAKASFATANWSTQGLAPGGIDTTSLYNLHFQLSTSSGTALKTFDVGVSYITWITAGGSASTGDGG